jgi:chloramphenicol O-acetyltransferase type A
VKRAAAVVVTFAQHKRMYQELDIEKWPRKSTYEFFKDYDDPFFNFTANVDVSALYRFCKRNELAFSLASLYCSLVAANEIREFRIRLLEGRLVEFDRIHATQTILNDDETFSFAYFEMKPDVFDFVGAGKTALEKYKTLRTFDVEADRVDLIYYSVIPWVSFTSFKHAGRFDKTQTVPRIVFGKIFDHEDRRLMPLSVEANHTIMDGLHVGKLFNTFQEIADSISSDGQ